MNTLRRSTPEAEGASSAGIHAAITALDALGGMHGLIVLRHGSVIAETWWQPYTPQTQQLLFSVSKSVTSTAVGLAISEGRLSLDDRVIDLLPEHVPADPSDNLAAMTVRHLLTMTTGHATDTMDGAQRHDESWVDGVLARPVAHPPGTHFVYNTGATHLLSAILQKLTGQRLVDYLEPRLFAPLEITGARWLQSPDGIDAGGFGLRLRLEDVARFGQLYLQHGEWNGTQVVPADWVAEATSALVPNSADAVDWSSGYGYQFWQNRDGTYRGDGAFGQFVIVLEPLDAVVVITSGSRDMGKVLDVVFGTLAPALDSAPSPVELPATLPSPLPAVHAREYSQQFYFPTNPLRIARASIEGAVLHIDEHRIPFAADSWALGGQYPVDGELEAVAASGGWVDDAHFRAHIRTLETPYTFTLDLALDGDTVDLRIEQNVSFAPVRSWRLVGGIGTAD